MLTTLATGHQTTLRLAVIAFLVTPPPPPIGERSIVTSVSVSVCACVSVCPQSYLQNYTPIFTIFLVLVTYGRDSSSVICYVLPVVMDDVIFAHKLRLLNVTAHQLKRSAHAALGLAINCAQ